MKILITGGRGQLGNALQRQLGKHELIIGDLPEFDIVDKTAVFQTVATAQPDLIIHCAAYTNVDGCAENPTLAYQINGLGTQNVALACQQLGAEMMHISTNEVFSGEDPDGYEEWMPLGPVNPYGRSKAAAEHHVRSLLTRYYIVRPAWLYAPGGKNFVHAILRHAKVNGRLRVVTDEIGNPTNINDLAVAIAQLIETKQYGTYHLVNSGHCSRWAFANEILRLMGLSDVENEQIMKAAFNRLSTPPTYAHLHNIAAAAIGITLRPWQEALADFIENEYLDERIVGD